MVAGALWLREPKLEHRPGREFDRGEVFQSHDDLAATHPCEPLSREPRELGHLDVRTAPAAQGFECWIAGEHQIVLHLRRSQPNPGCGIVRLIRRAPTERIMAGTPEPEA
ncbi:hypothetical protein ACX31A_11985 [Dermacoccus nishinomiyaensis]